MNERPSPMTPYPIALAPAARAGSDAAVRDPAVQRVLRNTYALLAMTLLFSAGVAAASLAGGWPAPGPLVTLVGALGLSWLVHRLQHSGWALLAVFALTGFLGASLAPLVGKVAALPGGGQAVALALATTGAVFAALSLLALNSRRDFSGLAPWLTVGLLVALAAGLAAWFLEIPALALAVSAAVALLSAGMMLMETSRIVHGGERNYVLATVGLYLSIYNLFASLLSLFGLGGSDD